ncbi:hypothetical protein [Acinetobacter sp. CAAS 2-6]|uniref:hypothetical protein n=1 Tax=Acinetobacter sp. CAAS 2-6 TaxID=3016358 RepID=UPI002DD630F5|nr:hypothetical protein [Acinetobacter sp. CAAS 2-6]
MAFFGFTPSEALLNDIQTIIEKKKSKELLYPLRDKIALQINEEIIDALLTGLVRNLPRSEKTEVAEKLAGYVKSTVAVLLKQLLSKADNTVVQQSIAFSEHSLLQDPQGQYKVGQPLDAGLVTNLKHSFAEIQAGRGVNKAALAELYKQFADEAVRHFMSDFTKTLDLGIIKRKAADLGAAGVSKAVNIAIDKLIPNMNKDELIALAKYHDSLFFH